MASTVRFKRAPYPKDAEGKNLCRCGCGRHPVKPRLHWFSDACVAAYMETKDPRYIRQEMLKRDKGICALCGCDCEAEYAKITESLQEVERYACYWLRVMRDRNPKVHIWTEWNKQKNAMLLDHSCGWSPGRSSGWDADHIVPVVEGGGECGLDNYRTLCHPCHKRVTAELAARRAKARRVKVQPELI